MTLLSAALDLLPSRLRSRLACHLGAPDLQWSLRQLRRFGLKVSSAVDAGAYQGAWARAFLDVFAEAEVLCVEPSPSCLPRLADWAKARKNVRVLHALLGDRLAEDVPYEDRGSGSSVLVPGAPLAHEVIDYLRGRRFMIWEIEEFIRSPSDGALWQIDAVFVREDSPLRVQRRWR